MSIKLPRRVGVALAVLGASLLLVSIYLETAHLDLLGRHPILVNLLSGIVGFCFGILALSGVLHGVLRRIELANLRVELSRECASCAERLVGLGRRLSRLHRKSARERRLIMRFGKETSDLARAMQRFPPRTRTARVPPPDILSLISGWLQTAELMRTGGLILDRPGLQEEIQACRKAAAKAFPSGTPQQMMAVIGQLQDLALQDVLSSRTSRTVGDVIFDAVEGVIPLRN